MWGRPGEIRRCRGISRSRAFLVSGGPKKPKVNHTNNLDTACHGHTSRKVDGISITPTGDTYDEEEDPILVPRPSPDLPGIEVIMSSVVQAHACARLALPCMGCSETDSSSLSLRISIIHCISTQSVSLVALAIFHMECGHTP